MSTIKEVRIREDDGSLSNAIPIGVDAENIHYNDGSNGNDLKKDIDNLKN